MITLHFILFEKQIGDKLDNLYYFLQLTETNAANEHENRKRNISLISILH